MDAEIRGLVNSQIGGSLRRESLPQLMSMSLGTAPVRTSIVLSSKQRSRRCTSTEILKTKGKKRIQMWADMKVHLSQEFALRSANISQ
jgi:hypothetical protein